VPTGKVLLLPLRMARQLILYAQDFEAVIQVSGWSFEDISGCKFTDMELYRLQFGSLPESLWLRCLRTDSE
jgi:hypothetical protein